LAPTTAGPESSRIKLTAQDQHRRLAYICLAFAVSCLLMAAKFYAFRLTGSAAILSDALESIINVAASAFAIVSVIMAAKPPDETHPYGHGKIEFFSAGFEGALIIIAAVGIFKSAVPRIITPQPVPHLDTGLLILLATSAVNFVVGASLMRIGRQTASLTLVADGKHLMSDVVTSLGVVAGLLVVKLSGWLWLDGLIACMVGVSIMVTGFMLVRQSFRGLMDAADPAVLKDLTELFIKNRADNWIDIHQLRAWKSGDHVHIDMHLVMPRDCSLEEAHAEAKALDALVIRHFGGRASTLIHLDACIEDDCPVCRSRLCRLRGESALEDPQWSLETFTARKDGGRFQFPTVPHGPRPSDSPEKPVK
jgi:cation diffusion facilitator family transporter